MEEIEDFKPVGLSLQEIDEAKKGKFKIVEKKVVELRPADLTAEQIEDAKKGRFAGIE